MTDNAPAVPETDEYRQELIERATLLGVPFHPNAKNETIAAKIRAKLEEKVEDAEMAVIDAKAEMKVVTPVPEREAPGKKIHPALALTRCIITCNDPQKADQSGDVISVSNGEIGDMRFYFHFNKPWHVPKIILDTIRESKLFLHSSRKDGKEVITREVPRYNIQELPPLDEKARERIAAKQAAALATED